MSEENQNYWIIEIYNNDTVNVSVMSQEEAKALENMGELEEWQMEPCSNASEEEMIERAEEHGYEHDPW